MKRLFKLRYPKILLLILCIIAAYFIFSQLSVQNEIHSIGLDSYWGMFVAGLLFSFGFTTPFAIGLFVTAHPNNIVLAALIGGVGAMLSDLLIFHFIRFSFMNEFEALMKTKIARELYLKGPALDKRIKHYLLYAFAGIIISSPLPDEVGVTMLAGLSHIQPKMLAIISYIFNTLGILIFLLI